MGALLGASVEIVTERHQACIMRLDAPLAYELPSVMDYVRHRLGSAWAQMDRGLLPSSFHAVRTSGTVR